MWSSKTSSAQRKGGGNGIVAVAINKDKGSQNALKWACDNLLSKGQSVVLIHVQKTPSSSSSLAAGGTNSPLKSQLEKITKDLFLTFHCFCTRKDIQCLDVILEDADVVKSLTEYVSYASVENLVLGTSSRHGFIRFKTTSIPSSVSKGAPDFCSVYVVSKGKISSVRNATRQATYTSPLLDQIENISKTKNDSSDGKATNSRERSSFRPRAINEDHQEKLPFAKVGKLYGDLPEADSDISFISSGRPDTDISFVSSARPSADRSSAYSLLLDEPNRASRVSTSSEPGFQFGSKMFESASQYEFSSVSQDIDRTSFSSQAPDEVESEMRRLKLELKQTMDMYSAACKEALTAKQKAKELSMVDNDRGEVSTTVLQDDIRYRRYTIEEIEAATDSFSESRKIGEGGYGPVYKCRLDHTPVAVKCLRPDAAQGRTQFNQEVEVLTCIRHPNMVLLLGACPEYGCLVYEHMANGSLEDCLFRKRNTPALSWQLRFRISAEIAIGLLFLHQTKPEPLVHRDLKPGNILLDSNYVSKISDVGLAKLVPSVAECHMTAAAGTFCYIDPEYQQTGMLGVKSDVYSLGILLLQLITAKPAMGLAHNVERAIEKGMLFEMLDPAVPDWPKEEVFCFAQLALRCAELRRKDRPDLGKEVLPELSRLRDIAEENMGPFLLTGGAGPYAHVFTS